MSFALRNYSGLLVAALGILAFALLGRSEVIGIARVPIAWLLFLGVPGWLGCRCFASSDDGLALDRWGLSLFAGWVLILSVFGLAAVLGLPTRSFLWLWGGACLVLAVVSSRTLSTLPQFRRGGWGLAAVLLGCVVFLARTPPELSVESDLAAHLGGVHDAVAQERWLPLDYSVRETEQRRDPRFGLLHGLHAAMSAHLRIDPVRELQWSAPFFAAVFILGHAALFLAMGLPSAIAVAVALLYAWGAGGGAPLGWWAGFYPSQVALGISAACVAVGMSSLRGERQQPGFALWGAGAGLGLSALVHPFAWWAWMLILAHAAFLTIFRSEMRGWLLPLARFALPAAVLGMVALLPLLLQGMPEASAQSEKAGILRFGPNLFTMDPFVVLRFGGWLSLLAAPVLLLASHGGWRKDPRIWLGLAAALPVWTIALNPFVQPLVFAKVGYLSERLGQMAWIPALGLLPIFVRASLAPKPAPRAIWTTTLAGAVLLLGTPHAVSSAIRSPYSWSFKVKSLEELREGLRSAGVERPACDPANSYALRGIMGGPALAIPVEHCSPLDDDAAARLAGYRCLLSPFAHVGLLSQRLRDLGADGLVLDENVEQDYRYPVFAFVPSNSHQIALAEQLKVLGVAPDAIIGSSKIYSLRSLEIARNDAPPRALEGVVECEMLAEEPVEGETFALLSVETQMEAYFAGEEMELLLCYTSSEEDQEFAGWEELSLRFEGPMPSVPPSLRIVGKPLRKLFLERSGRSKSRFTVSWIPFDGYGDPSSWNGDKTELRKIQIPPQLLPGVYKIQPSFSRPAWRPNRLLRDYLQDLDSKSGPDWLMIRIQPKDDSE